MTLYVSITELIKHRDASNMLLDGGKRETLETYDKLLKLSEEWLAINRG